MRNAIIFTCILLLLAACAQYYPLHANLNLEISTQESRIYSGTTASIRGVDGRANPEVVVYRLTDGAPVQINNLNPPHILISERIAGGFQQQGLALESSAPASIVVEVKELVATITRPKMLYKTGATSRIDVVVVKNGRAFTKNYQIESTRESMSRPEVDELETLLNTQLSDIVGQILEDKGIQDFLVKG